MTTTTRFKGSAPLSRCASIIVGSMVVEEFIASAPWTYAKSMPSMPHEYVVTGKVPDDAAFDAFVA
jgi:hypothetical protein